jgi:hypothetical protein
VACPIVVSKSASGGASLAREIIKLSKGEK